jgi:riboflavin kinase/FMN adenylyltransferase
MVQSARAPMARYPQAVPQRLWGGAVSIGNFDGVHRGHELLLGELRRIAGQRSSIVVSFYPHPVRVLRPEVGLRYISSVREKAERLGSLGVDLLYFVRFSRTISRISAREFIERILVGALRAKDLVVGEDVAIGQGREGNLEFLRRELPNYGIHLHVIAKLEVHGRKAGSRRIRDLIAAGDVERATELMGTPFTISARVGHGDKRGSEIGFPTANIAVGPRLIPKSGVYGCRVEVEGSTYVAVANIGTRPTFAGHGLRLEVHILDFPYRRLYGTRIHVSFLSRLRDERKFESVEALKTQISEDIACARKELQYA